ncbi:hypothetical protein [Bradyrhizobium genosp. P]|uniref:hypothetical protein n=1 Tax=Bradyrhizobium genosp. P TaxID=83641 RepID=UPI003CED7179
MDLHVQDKVKHEGIASAQSMRAFLSKLADAGELVTMPEALDLKYDIAAFLAEAKDGPAIKIRRG